MILTNERPLVSPEEGAPQREGKRMKNEKGNETVQKLVLGAMFLAIGMVLPFLTGQIPQVGKMLLPMHLPVLLCGLICGWQYGGAVGFILPLLRHAVFGTPPMPNGLAMAFELAAYGILVGVLYGFSRWKCILSLYRALIGAMIGGRLVWAGVRVIMTGTAGVPFTWEIFLADAFLGAIPGIILQLVAIPALMLALHRTGLVHLQRKKPAVEEAK